MRADDVRTGADLGECTLMHDVQRPPTRPPRYVAPSSLTDALTLLADEGARPIAGGTDLLVELARAEHAGLELLVDLGRIPGLDEIRTADDGIHLGALVTHHQVVASAVCRDRLLPLAQACLEIGSAQLRNRATVVGNVVTASPANDTISALLALAASVEVTSPTGARRLPLDEFITGFRTVDLAPGELVTDVVAPPLAPGERGVFVKLGLRRAQAISVVHLAAVVALDGGVVTEARLALGSVAPTVVLVPGLAELLRGRPLAASAIEDAIEAAVQAARPIDDLRAPADYRTDQVATMTRRALAALADDTQADRWPDRPPLLWHAGFDGRFPTGDGVELGPDDAVSCEVNGAVVSAAGATGVTLLDWLRDELGVCGVKEGCAEGECGACTVDLDGASVMACLVPAGRAHGATIRTVEGLATDGALHPIQRAFVEADAVQCGYCTPGLLMAGAALVAELADPTPDQVRRGLGGNLCRCTGYGAIERAVSVAGRAEAST